MLEIIADEWVKIAPVGTYFRAEGCLGEAEESFVQASEGFVEAEDWLVQASDGFVEAGIDWLPMVSPGNVAF